MGWEAMSAGVCGRAEAPEDAAPGGRYAATIHVASTIVRCGVVAYFPERWFAPKPCTLAAADALTFRPMNAAAGPDGDNDSRA